MARPQPRIISPAGRRATRDVGLARLASAIATGVSLAAAARLFTHRSASALVVATIAAAVAGACAVVERSWGGRAARAEERRLRAGLLHDQFTTAGAPDTDADEGLRPARVVQLMTDNVERVTEFRQVYLGSTMAALVIPVVTLIGIGVFVDPVVGFGVLATAPLIPLALGGFMHLFRRSSAHSRSERSRLAGRYLDALRNLVTIRLLGAGPRVEAELRAHGEANRGAIMRLLAGNQIVIIVMDGIFSLLLICLTAGLTIARAGHLDPSDVLTVMLLTILLLEPLTQVAGFFYIGMGGIASQKALRAHALAVTDAVADQPTEAETAAGEPRPGTTITADPAIAVGLEDVRFDYGRGPVLRGVDLSVAAGERVAITGVSGAGKSTMFDLLRGAVSVQEGRITLAGRDLAATDPATIRSLSAVVTQTTWMFTGTIADNLRLARADATTEEMWDALRRARIADEVAGMPHGLETDLGEGAALVSGGQAQRISLARALLSGRRVLLLDEPTSQVDVESESHIIDAIDALPRDLTVVLITHRPALLRIVDTTYHLADGRLVGGPLTDDPGPSTDRSLAHV